MSQPDPLSVDQFLAHLQAVRRVGDNWQAACPAHDDKRASLSVGLGDDGRILVKCHAGCTFNDIVNTVGVAPASLFPAPDHFQTAHHGRPAAGQMGRIVAMYDYRDAGGELRYQVCRFDPKDFRQRQPDPAKAGAWRWSMAGVTRLPYRLDQLKDQATVYVVEGEKDADALWALGLPATTNLGGAGKWRDSDSEYLRAAGVGRLVILPDNDPPGKKHADQVTKSAKAAGLGVAVLPLEDLPAKGDVSDWLHAGHTRDELEARTVRALFTVAKADAEPEPPPCDADDHPLRWVLSDAGAAEAFAYRYRDRVRYDHQKEQWLVWNGHYWKPDATREVHRLALEHARLWQQEAVTYVRDHEPRARLLAFTLRLERRQGVENLLGMSNAMLPIADDGDGWDIDPWLLGCPNGVVDLKTSTLRAGRADDRITLQTHVPYLADAPCPRWEVFLDQVFNGDTDLIAYVQRGLGYSLTANIREQCFFMCVGAGSNGKSVFLSTLEYVWGHYAYTTSMQTFTNQAGADGADYNLAELAGRRLILASETKANSQFNETALKNFTGGEKINAQRKYGHPFEYTPKGKIWIGVNHQPRVKDESHGFWRRVRLIPFLKTFSGTTDDRSLKDTLRAESAGILAWAIRGTMAWQDLGLQPPMSVLEATDAYQESEDPLHDFILERVVFTKTASTSATTAYLAYKEWAHEQGLSEREALTSTMFGRLLSRRFSKTHTENGKRYEGITVKRNTRDLLSE